MIQNTEDAKRNFILFNILNYAHYYIIALLHRTIW